MLPEAEHQHDDPDEEERIGDIADVGPDVRVAAGPLEPEGKSVTGERVDEVAHAGVDDPVVQISDPAADDEPDRNMREVVSSIGPESEEGGGEEERGRRETDEEPAAALACAEHCAAVEHELEVEDAGDDRDRSVHGEQVEQQVGVRADDLEHLVPIELDGVVGDVREGEMFGGEVQRDAEDDRQEQDDPRTP